MSRRRASEKPKTLEVGPFGPRNLAEVYQFVDWAPSVTPAIKRKALGALRMLGRLHTAVKDEPLLDVLARIPANIPLLRSYLAKSHARRHLYSDGAWRNMRSGVVAALRASNVKVRQGRRRVPLPDHLQNPLDRLPEAHLRILYPFARTSFEHGHDPFNDTDAAFAHYETYLENFDGRSRPRATFLAVIKSWNWACTNVQGWSTHTVEAAPRYDRYVLPWSAFDPRLEAEVERLMHEAQHPDPLRLRRRKRINGRTARHQTEQLQRIASALVHATGCDPKSIHSIAQLVEPTSARTALRFMAARALKRQASNRE